MIGEIALGHLGQREEIPGPLASRPQAVRADDHGVLSLIRDEGLRGLGIGHVDARLLAAGGPSRAPLWAADRRLAAAAARLGTAYAR